MKLYLLLTLILSNGLNAQNLLINSEFDNNLAGWQLTGAQLPIWDSFDIDNSASSGSAFISNIEIDPSTDVEVLHQCIANDSGKYSLGSMVYIPDNQSETGSVVIRYITRLNSNNCTGGSQATGGALYSQTGQWGLINFDVDYQPGGSLEYIIAIRKTETNGGFVAYIDDAYLFSDVIFKNSFE